MTARKLAPTKLTGGGRGQDVGQPADLIRAHAGPQPGRRSNHEFRALLNEAGSTGLEGIGQQGRRCCRRYDPAASGRRALSRAISAPHRNRACLSAVAPDGQGLRKPHEVPGIANERTKWRRDGATRVHIGVGQLCDLYGRHFLERCRPCGAILRDGVGANHDAWEPGDAQGSLI
jgi:hypothetical protein